MLEIPTPDPDIKRRHSNPSLQTGKRNFVPTGQKSFNNIRIYAKLDAELV